MNDRLPDESTDKLVDVWMEANCPRVYTFGKFCPGILICIFTMKFADGWMERADDGQSDRQTNFEVESHLG